MSGALRNWRVRGSAPRALKPISPKPREAGPRSRDPGPAAGGSPLGRGGSSGVRARPPRLARVASHVGFVAPPGLGSAGAAVGSAHVRCCYRRRGARLSCARDAGGRRALTSRALRLTPCAFTSPFAGSTTCSLSAHAPSYSIRSFLWKRAPHRRHRRASGLALGSGLVWDPRATSKAPRAWATS